MAKNGSQCKILVFSFPLVPILVSFEANRGRGMKMGIHTVEKWKMKNFEQNTCYIPQKKAKNMHNSDSGRKSMNGIFFSLFQNFKIPFWKMALIGLGKCSKKKSHKIWDCLEHPLRNQKRSFTRGGSVTPPPPLVEYG